GDNGLSSTIALGRRPFLSSCQALTAAPQSGGDRRAVSKLYFPSAAVPASALYPFPGGKGRAVRDTTADHPLRTRRLRLCRSLQRRQYCGNPPEVPSIGEAGKWRAAV